MNHDLIELEQAYDLVLEATDRLWDVEPEDMNAAVVALLARAIEVASNRKLRSLDEIFQNTR